MKLLWRLLTDQTNLWSNIIQEKYLRNCPLLDCQKSVAKSWQFNKLLSLIPEFKKGLRWQVGNGEKINFWYDNWMGNRNLEKHKTIQPNQQVRFLY